MCPGLRRWFPGRRRPGIFPGIFSGFGVAYPVTCCYALSIGYSGSPTGGFTLRLRAERRAIMAPRSLSVSCPATVCTCGGSLQVTATPGKDRRTGRLTVTYSPCAALVAQGWTGNVASVEWADA